MSRKSLLRSVPVMLILSVILPTGLFLCRSAFYPGLYGECPTDFDKMFWFSNHTSSMSDAVRVAFMLTISPGLVGLGSALFLMLFGARVKTKFLLGTWILLNVAFVFLLTLECAVIADH